MGRLMQRCKICGAVYDHGYFTCKPECPAELFVGSAKKEVLKQLKEIVKVKTPKRKKSKRSK